MYLHNFIFSFWGTVHGRIRYKYFLNRSIWLVDGTLIGTTTPDQTKPGSNDI